MFETRPKEDIMRRTSERLRNKNKNTKKEDTQPEQQQQKPTQKPKQKPSMADTPNKRTRPTVTVYQTAKKPRQIYPDEITQSDSNNTTLQDFSSFFNDPPVSSSSTGSGSDITSMLHRLFGLKSTPQPMSNAVQDPDTARIMGLVSNITNNQSDMIDKIIRLKISDDPRLQSQIDNLKASMIHKITTDKGPLGGSGDNKYQDMITRLLQIPFGKYSGPVKMAGDTTYDTLKRIERSMNECIYGQFDAKKSIMDYITTRIVHQETGAPPGNCLLFVGPPGVGKTRLAQHGISAATNQKFVSIQLGGKSDAFELTGYGMTYAGSRPGCLVSEITAAGVMNPVIFFDELDKVSQKSEDIFSALIQITDPTQNSTWKDAFFQGVPIDLSKVLFVFSCNDLTKVNRILLERMHIIEFKKYTDREKPQIITQHILPELLAHSNVKITFSDYAIDCVLSRAKGTTETTSLRPIKKVMSVIISRINTFILASENMTRNISELSLVDKLPIQMSPDGSVCIDKNIHLVYDICITSVPDESISYFI